MALTQDGKFELLVWLVSFAYLAVGNGLTGYLLLVTREVPATAERGKSEARRWWRFALPWVIIVLATDYFFDLDLLFLAPIMGKEELAIFGVCARIYVLVSFGLTAVYAVTMPEIMESSARQGLLDNAGFRKKVGDTNLAASVIAVIILLGVAVGSPLALMLFGPEFLVGVVPLTVMSLCLVVRAVMGPAALALSIHDRPYTGGHAGAVGMGVIDVAHRPARLQGRRFTAPAHPGAAGGPPDRSGGPQLTPVPSGAGIAESAPSPPSRRSAINPHG
jgi:O-antigen/teichoic acid export membrane protein